MGALKLDWVLGSGWSAIQNALKSTSENTKKVYTDVERLTKSASQLEGNMRAVGIAGLLSLGGIAAISPSLAGAMARLEVAGFKIAETIGKQLQPAFEWFAGAMENVAGFMEQNPWAAQIAAGFLGIAAVVSVGGALWSGLTTVLGLLNQVKGIGSIMLPIVLSVVIPNILRELLGDYANPGQEAGIQKITKDTGLDAIPGFTGGSEGLARTGNALSSAGLGDFIVNSTPLGGLVKGISTIGSLLGAGSNQYNPLEIAQGLGGGIGGGVSGLVKNLVIQIVDQNGQLRDYMVASGQESGGTQ